MRSQDIRFDVTAATGIDEPVQVAGSLHLPDAIEDGAALDLVLALHGGGYRRSYWHPAFGADDGYSFARFLTDRGKAVLALDHLGMGDSSRPERESKLSRARIAAANAQALVDTVRGLADGRYAKARSISATGVGHSIGGMMLITQMAAHRGMDRVAILGWANQPMVLGDTDVAALTAGLLPEGYLPTPRGPMRGLFYLADVPMAVVEADEANASETPCCLGRDALTPGIVHDAAAAIEVPVFLLYGAVDTSPDPYGEVAFFRGSSDVTLCVLEGSAHCQNFAGTRRAHWDRLDRWIDSLKR
jgi:pimeloyl-ACP methyl ester carboxylesterase